MSGKKARGPPSKMMFGRKDYEAEVLCYENQALNSQLNSEQSAQKIAFEKAEAATIERRKNQSLDAQNIGDFADVKKYFTLKIRDKEQKIAFYKNKLKETLQEREDVHKKIQSEHDQLKQAHELELTQLTNALRANKQRRDAMATVAALEIQLKREIEEAEETLQREKTQQSQQMSTALGEYYMLHQRHEKELKDGIEREMAKNRGMTAENLERTVIEMMRDKDAEIKSLIAQVAASQQVTDANTELMKENKQLYMERDLLQKETDSMVEKISKNDGLIRKLVEELKIHDQRLTGTAKEVETISEDVEEDQNSEIMSREVPKEPIQDDDQDQRPDRETILNDFFESSVAVLCDSVVKILGLLDSTHTDDYNQFHNVFTDFEGRKKELRFLMSKLGNLTFDPHGATKLQPAGLEEIEGVDADVARKKIIDPQKKAIEAFAEPIGDDEFPKLLATHFFQ